jgi:Ca2+-binding EF-hand superfamily protein
MVTPLALAGISTAFGLLQSITKRSEKSAEASQRPASFAEEARQTMPTGKPGKDVEALFKALDADGNGSIGKSEFAEALSKAKESGRGRAGEFARETFGALLALQEQGQKAQSASGLMEKVFARLDSDGDKTVTQQEFMAAMPPGRAKEAKKDGLEALFNSMDENKDGKLSIDEIRLALQTMRDETGKKADGTSGGATLTPTDIAAETTGTPAPAA